MHRAATLFATSRLFATSMLCVALAGPAMAETILRLAETARVLVRPDELAASLRVEAAAASAADAQGQVNAAMARAVTLARRSAGVAVTTGYYAVWPEQAPSPGANRPAGKPDWHASQTLDLRSTDGAALLALVGALQTSGLAVSQLTWQMTTDTARHARAEATRQALAGLRGRADEAAAILGLHFDSFREIRLDSVRPQPMPMPRAMAAAPAAARPAAEAEDVSVEAGAEADVVLK